MEDLQEIIVKKREEMIQAGMRDGLDAKTTLQVSCELDGLIVNYQRRMTKVKENYFYF